MNNKVLVILCSLAVLTSCSIYAQESNGNTQNKNLQSEMELTMPGAEEEGFRGTDSSCRNYLEDYTYQTDENSLIYSGSGEKVGNNNQQLSGKPQVIWTITDDNDPNNVVSNPSNETSNKSNFTNPGCYKVHNSGSRQLTDAGGAAKDGSKDGKGDTGDNSGGKGKANGIATANQTIGVTVHDVTAPDLWLAFEECVGNDFASSEEDLSNKMVEKILAKAGEPFVTKDNYQDIEGTSYIFVDEGKSADRNKIPENKTVRYTLCGNLFNSNGTPTLNGEVISTKVLDKSNKTQQAVVEGGNKNDVFKGVYVRRNVPFIAVVRSVDNGDKRKSVGAKEADGVKFVIKDSNGTEIQPDANGGYLFRVPNYPREDYSDQPDYYFEAQAEDVSKNLTKIKAPLYIVNTSASFEGSTNR